MQTLHVSWGLVWHVSLALQDITAETAAEVLPALDWIYLDAMSFQLAQLASIVEKFVAMRRFSGCPVTALVDTEMEFDEILKSYIGK